MGFFDNFEFNDRPTRLRKASEALGTHTLILSTARIAQPDPKNPKARNLGQFATAHFVVMESTTLVQGSKATEAWFVEGQNGDMEGDRLQAFAKQLYGAPDVDREKLNAMFEANDARGILVRAIITKETSKKGTEYQNIQWVTVPDQDIAKQKAWLDVNHPETPASTPAPAAAPAPAAKLPF